MHAIPSVATAHQRPLAASAPSMWRRSRVDLSYPVFESLDPLREGLTNVPGVVVLWDAQTNPGAGVPGRCIYVGQSRDLAAAVALLRDDAALAAAAAVGLRITWAPIGIAHRPGVVAYLREALKPVVAECGLDALWPVRPGVRPVPVPLPH